MCIYVGLFAAKGFSKCEGHLKSCYLNRPMEPTKWSKLGGHTLHLDVTIMNARKLQPGFLEEHAMGHVNGVVQQNSPYVTIEDMLHDGNQNIVLIEGDPGAGKTTITVEICRQWAEGNLLTNELVFLVPLRDKRYQKVANLNELFDVLKCSALTEYAEQSYGKELVFVLDGWDELPDDLQSQSFFHDIIFKKSALTCSTIIVTSRPSCSDHIAEAVQQDHYYQILGFTPEKVELYIKEYFKSNPQTANELLNFLKERENLRQHFYLPITLVIVCFVYDKSNSQIPETLSKLYESFVLHCLRPHLSDDNDKKCLKSLNSMPDKIRPVFSELCRLALHMLNNNQLTFSEDEFGISDEDLRSLFPENTEQFDGFGLLHVQHNTTEHAEKEKCYSFIHRAVQELLAAISILESETVEDTIDKHFREGSYLTNMFSFVFGLIPKKHLRPLAEKLKSLFLKSGKNRRLLSTILCCMFEAQDESLCHEFSQVFSQTNEVNLQLATLLEYRYASYFLSVCYSNNINVDMSRSTELKDEHAKVLAAYPWNTTKVSSFKCLVQLSPEGMKHFAKVLSCHHNLQSVKLYSIGFHAPDCFRILCNSICQYNPQISDINLPYAKLSIQDLDSLGHLLTTSLSLEGLHLNECVPAKDVSLISSLTFCDSLCKTSSLKYFCFGSWSLSWVESEAVGKILSENFSLNELHAFQVTTVNCFGPILDGLASNTTVTLFKAWPESTGSSDVLGKCLEKCLRINSSLTSIELVGYTDKHVLWSSVQVGAICNALQANSTLVTLDISGCLIDKDVHLTICVMLFLNTTLKHLFLNPIQMEKPEAVAIIGGCNFYRNATVEILSLVKWPKEKFSFSGSQEVTLALDQVQKSRQEKNKPLLNVVWLVTQSYMLVVLVLIPSSVIGESTSVTWPRRIRKRIRKSYDTKHAASCHICYYAYNIVYTVCICIHLLVLNC